MTILLRSLAITALCVLATSCAARAALSGASKAQQALKQAEADAEAGRLAEALPLFEQALASADLRPSERARALYGGAMLRLSVDANLRDVTKARTYLEELRMNFPDVHKMEVSAAAGFLEELAASEARVQQALQAQQAELDRMRADLQQQISAAQSAALTARTSADGQVQQVREELAAVRRNLATAIQDLETAQAELKKKDEALKRLARRAIQPKD